ncbi:MAG: hypothetical protein WA957_11530 [Alteraurantiacibacter sp.]
MDQPTALMEWSDASATVAAIAIVLSVLSFGFTYLLDKRGDPRDDRIEKSRAYLESGRGNNDAHRFFERDGFEILSHVFAKQLKAT